MIKLHSTIIPDCVWIEPKKFEDNRGIFCETFKSSFLPHFKPVQTNYSFSKKGVLRGVHRTPYAKLDINWPIAPTIISDKDKNCCD